MAEISSQYEQILRHQPALTAFDKAKMQDLMMALFKSVEQIDLASGTEVFRFEGDPQPPNGRVKAKLGKAGNDDVAAADSGIKPAQPDHTGQKHVHLDGLQNTKVKPPVDPKDWPGSINIARIESSELHVRCTGPVMLRDVFQLTIVVECHQLRIHNAHGCTIVALVGSERVVIEDSDGLVFYGLRDSKLEEAKFAVDDFGWPSRMPNPHFERGDAVKLASTATSLPESIPESLKSLIPDERNNKIG